MSMRKISSHVPPYETMRLLVPTLSIALAAIMVSAPARAAVVKLDGREYNVVDYLTLARSGFRAGATTYDTPSVYNGVPIVTVASIQYTCDFDQYTGPWRISKPLPFQVAPPAYDFSFPPGITTYWGKLPTARLEAFRSACKRLQAQLQLPDGGNWAPIITVYGVIRNGTGGTREECIGKAGNFLTDSVRRCLHLEVHELQFTEMILTGREAVAQIGLAALKTVGPSLLELVLRTATRQTGPGTAK